ncbi:ABC transporter ATP-binding protein [Paenibacillus sp. B-A-8]|uniref:ABC transporter ATP-binding protein n=1 Tax=Paenibacillus sp. B-A-8 TaxID=3400419 RepID=UPI003B023DD7
MKYFKWTWTYLKRQKLLLVLILVLTVIQIITQFGGNFYQKQLIDDVIVKGDMNLLRSTILIIGVCYLLHASLTFLSPYVSLQNYSRLRLDMSGWLLRYINQVSILRIQRERINDMVSLFLWQLHLVPFALSDRLWNFIQNLTLSLALIIFIAWVSPKMLFICILTAIIYVWLGYFYGIKTKEARKKVWDARYKLGVCLEEGVSATREITAYNLDEWDSSRYNSLFKEYYDHSMQEVRTNNKKLIWSKGLEWVTLLFIFFYGAYMVYNGQMSIGVFVVTYIFGTQYLSTVLALFDSGTDIIGHLTHVERIMKFTEQPIEKSGERRLKSGVQTIYLDKITFRYPEQESDALHEIECELPIGKTIGIVGGSGSGKSTLAGILFGLHDPGEGNVLVNGIPLKEWDYDDWKMNTAIVLQEPYLFHDTLRQNLLMGQEISDEAIMRVLKIVQLESFIHSLLNGLDTIIGERGITLSGGQRQRVALARALLRPSEVLILDEATSALDLETERKFQAALRQERLGKTTVIVAHRLSTIRDADLILVMDNGHVVEQGGHSVLMALGGYYRKLVDTQENIYQD